ncbi:hypothetical protein ABDB91_08485 [Desulfoscipio sp. XC116]
MKRVNQKRYRAALKEGWFRCIRTKNGFWVTSERMAEHRAAARGWK